ncbi:hypothetical protein K9B32_25625 [Rhizobium sp. 3T7]|nr:hypothetical protein [Rhizobium sp. 3T7]MBZ9793446.1 hypothetical protein [Rhizobium sp. 3T7]
MNRFLALAAAGALVSLSAIIAACTTNSDQTSSIGFSSSYQYNRSANPACSGGFRPSNGRSCSY